MLDGDFNFDYSLAYAPPPEVQPAPPGGVLGGPDLTSGGNGTGYYPGSPAGGDFPPPAPEGEPGAENYVPLGTGPVAVAPFDAFA